MDYGCDPRTLEESSYSETGDIPYHHLPPTAKDPNSYEPIMLEEPTINVDATITVIEGSTENFINFPIGNFTNSDEKIVYD